MTDVVWVDELAEEMSGAHFADARLRKRLGLMVRTLGQNPAMSFPKAFESSELEAAYRFMSNAVVTPELILSAHVDATRARCIEQQTVLVVHDTTKFGFREDGKRAGLGRLNKSGQVFFGHFAIALCDDGTRRPLGVVGFKAWARGDEKPNGSESARWAELVDVAHRNLCGASLLHVIDREADDYALFAHFIKDKRRFIVREKSNRLLVTEGPNDPKKLNDAVARIERVVECDAKLSKRIDGKRSPNQKRIHPTRSPRIAKLAVGATTITIKRPTTQSDTLADSLELNVVRVWEPEPPLGEPGVEWVLLTSEPIASVEDIVRIVDRYRARWVVEEFFKAIKTGCSYEKRQLGDFDSLVNALAIFAPIACEMLVLRTEARINPSAPANDILSEDHIEVLRVLGRKPLPACPTVRDVLLAIAALGGHIKYSGEPGWLTLSRGFTELIAMTRGWKAAKSHWARHDSSS